MGADVEELVEKLAGGTGDVCSVEEADADSLAG
jgi:hypothetical protein